MQLLLSRGANIEAKDNKTKDMPNGPLLYTALIAAAQEGRVEAMKVLLEAGGAGAGMGTGSSKGRRGEGSFLFLRLPSRLLRHSS